MTERAKRGRPTRVENEPADQRTPVYLTKREKSALESRAKKQRVPVASLIREAVDDYLDDIGEDSVFSSAANSA